jgi:hypothetical protein
MTSRIEWDMAKQRVVELRDRQATAGYSGRHGRDGDATRPSVRRGQGVATWLGYRMIGIGCRLARPAVVAHARSGM